MDPRPVDTAPSRAGLRGLSWRARLVVVAVALACACVGVSAPSLADPGAGGVSASATPEELLDAFLRVAEASDARALATSGYSFDRRTTYAEGGYYERKGWYHVNDSVRYEESYVPAANSENPPQKVAYVWDSVNKRFSSPRPSNSKEAKKAYQLLGAKDSAWLVRKSPDFPGAKFSTEEGAPSWFLISILFEAEIAGGSMSEDGTRLELELFPLMSTVPEGTLTVTIGAFGEATSLVFEAENGSRSETTLRYEEPRIVTPSGSNAVRYHDYEVALQSLDLEWIVEGRVVIVAADSAPATPAKILRLARAQAKEAKEEGLHIPIKVSKIASGARMSARNPFSGATVAYEIVADKPYPDSSPTYRRIS